MPLSQQSRDIILGSILGDGSLKLHTGYKNARFSFRHSVDQEEYFYWKANALSEVAGKSSIFKQESTDGDFGTNDKLRFQSVALPGLTDLFDLTHERGKFAIKSDWLNQINEPSLAMWWFDDGSIIGNGRKGVLCTDGFDKSSNETLARYLQDTWRINVGVGKVSGKNKQGTKDIYYRLYFYSTKELKKFLRIILPHLPVEEMLYKVVLLYRDAQFQQRWISEVAMLSGLKISTVKKEVENRKSRWKIFRE